MNKDTLINLRVSKVLKDDFQAIVEKEGFTMSEILEASMIDVTKRKMVPIYLKGKVKRHREPLITIPYIKSCLEDILFRINNPKIKSVSLFGSYATGNVKQNSDIDLFLDVEDGFSLFELSNLQTELENKLEKKVDIATRTDDDYFNKVIQKEKITLYERVS